jgi:hypothetical protein
VRYAIRPDGALERLALWLDVVPVPVVDVLVPLLKVRSIMAAVKLGVFAALADGPERACELAARLSLDPGCLESLLRVLVGSDYLRRRGDRFELTALAEKLIPDASDGLSGYVAFNYEQWDFVARLEDTLQSGRGIDFHASLPATSEAWSRYQQAMLELARPVAGYLAEHVPVPAGARRLLDLGGSHGLLGAALCRAHPPLTSTVLELPAALPSARQLACAEGIADVVEHRPGDALCADYGEDYDVVLIANLLHHFTSAELDLVLSRALRGLRQGGTLALWETEAPERDAAAELASDALALYFRITSSAPPVSASDLERRLLALGCRDVAVRRSLRAPGRVLLHTQRNH